MNSTLKIGDWVRAVAKRPHIRDKCDSLRLWSVGVVKRRGLIDVYVEFPAEDCIHRGGRSSGVGKTILYFVSPCNCVKIIPKPKRNTL